MRFFHKLNVLEKQTFKLHASFAILEGVMLGILALNEFVFISALHGENYQVAVLFAFSMAVFVLLIFINEFIKRIKNKRLLLRIVGTVTRLPLFLILFFPTNDVEIIANSIYHYIFLAIFLIYYMGNPIIRPTINLFLKTTYTHENFGKLFSYAASINKIIMLITTFVVGLLLDFDKFAIVYVYPAMAIFGIVSVFLLSNIKYKENIVVEKYNGFIDSIKNSIYRMINILKNNKPYLFFEISFMLYGFAFMISIAVITIFYGKQALELNYSSVAFYKNMYNVIAILMLPFFGRLIGKIDPRKFGIITFSSLFIYLLLFAVTDNFRSFTIIFGIKIYYFLIPAFLSYGVFAATMHLLWSIGSAYFCKSDEADIYQSVHLSLTGLRALIIPIFGIFIYEIFGFTVTFLIGGLSVFLGIIVLFYSFKKHKLVKQI